MDGWLGSTAWSRMWTVAVLIYLVCKWLTWSTARVDAPAWKHLAYWLAWPGMQAGRFLQKPAVKIAWPPLSEWGFAALKCGFGLALLFVVAPRVEQAGALATGWTAMFGVVFVLHFGLFHLLSCFWRRCGVDAPPLMDWPIASASLAEFWGRRWNVPFRDLTHQFLFNPLRSLTGASAALLISFVVSGLIHELVISWPSGAGWGLPTLYFTIQGIALLMERGRFARRLGLGRGGVGWLYCCAVLVIPLPLLFPEPFATEVMAAFLRAVGGAA